MTRTTFFAITCGEFLVMTLRAEILQENQTTLNEILLRNRFENNIKRTTIIPGVRIRQFPTTANDTLDFSEPESCFVFHNKTNNTQSH